MVFLDQSQKVFIYVGGMGLSYDGTTAVANGNSYNGGGAGIARCCSSTGGLAGGSGGGATHIAKVSGLLRNISAHATNGNILIVAGGGGGGMQYATYSGQHSDWSGYGGAGGGTIGVEGIPENSNFYCKGWGGTQTSAGANTPGISNCNKATSGGFGYGGSGPMTTDYYHAGGGGGYYGGAAGIHAPGAGGSGYIGSSSLISYGSITKHMTCYSCTTSSATADQTFSNINVSATATPDFSKSGNGYARITYIGALI